MAAGNKDMNGSMDVLEVLEDTTKQSLEDLIAAGNKDKDMNGNLDVLGDKKSKLALEVQMTIDASTNCAKMEQAQARLARVQADIDKIMEGGELPSREQKMRLGELLDQEMGLKKLLG